MGRPTKGWTLRPDHKTGNLGVRFTHKRKQEEISTGTADPVAAAAEAARIYAETISGRRQRGVKAASGTDGSLAARAAEWLDIKEAEVAKKTFEMLERHLSTHLIPFFKDLDSVTTLRCKDYVTARLRLVKSISIRKECSTWRQFTFWCFEKNYIPEAPTVQSPKRNVLGTPDTKRKHKAEGIALTEAEAQALIAEAPVQSERARRGHTKHWVRDAFVVIWETGLRPSTVQRLEVPKHYRKGARELNIDDAIDKARYGRKPPLTQKAREALDRCAPDIGLIFGEHSLGAPFRKAALKAAAKKKIALDRAEAASPYDFRHGRITELAQGPNLPGVAFLVGHKDLSTTSKYIHPPKSAAVEVLAADKKRRTRKGRAR